ncbi:hypothetical protein [Parapedobacter sp. DT-150]|uniref:hypothetical protein n=1 Tax=Parapedobacter sp. DT-150 TaxID=3396162 RepID=UPI003F193396
MRYNEDLLYNHQERFLPSKPDRIKAQMRVISDAEPYEFEISFPKKTNGDSILLNHRVITDNGDFKYIAPNDFEDSSGMMHKAIYDWSVTVMNKLSDFKKLYGNGFE